MNCIRLHTLRTALFLSTYALLIGCASSRQEQVLEVYDVRGTEATARLTVDGREVFTTTAYIGKNGIGKTGEGDAKTPTGTLRAVGAFGVKPNPGTAMPYTRVTASTFACDEPGPYYNQIVDTARVHHAGCTGEDMLHTVPEYDYGLSTDFNAACRYPDGSNIFVHCKGRKTWTGGCIALDEDKMLELLCRCDTTLVIRIRP
ncbi:MAG: L,D-transpeptidase family protein [Bacteroidaceae bacterium]|nr:L,D-transpeptidase family protein [Bacteroidaceae bacterium]